MTNPVVLRVIFHSEFKVSFKLINQKALIEKKNEMNLFKLGNMRSGCP